MHITRGWSLPVQFVCELLPGRRVSMGAVMSCRGYSVRLTGQRVGTMNFV
jgi:hypothetical protein